LNPWGKTARSFLLVSTEFGRHFAGGPARGGEHQEVGSQKDKSAGRGKQLKAPFLNVASESYDDFARELQAEHEED
jgi:hypothetical protein